MRFEIPQKDRLEAYRSYVKAILPQLKGIDTNMCSLPRGPAYAGYYDAMFALGKDEYCGDDEVRCRIKELEALKQLQAALKDEDNIDLCLTLVELSVAWFNDAHNVMQRYAKVDAPLKKRVRKKAA